MGDPASMIQSEVWYRDGNVVLQAKNTQFRVHWSVLAQHSSVFRGMDGLPQPPDQPSIDGCQIVELADDPQDVEYLLKALYVPAFHCEKTLPLPVTGALIRLGRKYDFKYLLDSAVARVTAHLPSTLEKWDALRNGETSGSIDWEDNMRSATLDLITLASESNIFSALPSAYYVAIDAWNPGDLFDGIQRADSTRAVLSNLDLRRCIVGQQRLLHKQLQPGYTLGWARNWEFVNCADPARCSASQKIILSFFLDDVRPHVAGLMLPTALLLQRDFALPKFCDSCNQGISESMVGGRKRMWDELPGIFDLPPWSELKNEI
ncbi:hypothetical protein C8R45DRAFT_914207 [Mycena sanguinolenta]|nr:hypothetical protein C8R45DRAFT_914207 [Mycena sanguinolenta]